MPENFTLSPLVVVFEFHLRSKDAARPEDANENSDRLEWGPGISVPIPAVGDTVSYKAAGLGAGATDGEQAVVTRKIVSRHFDVHQHLITVRFVVSDEEMNR